MSHHPPKIILSSQQLTDTIIMFRPCIYPRPLPSLQAPLPPPTVPAASPPASATSVKCSAATPSKTCVIPFPPRPHLTFKFQRLLLQPSSAAEALGLLGIVNTVEGLVGWNCSPITALGLGGSTCEQEPVCCTDNTMVRFFLFPLNVVVGQTHLTMTACVFSLERPRQLGLQSCQRERLKAEGGISQTRTSCGCVWTAKRKAKKIIHICVFRRWTLVHSFRCWLLM
ncbi:hypothetical protein J3R82DRAFT_7779 [Butyriboletus roseoflavus]|nr:hypothetical protein J3R82DRAFT_7779 [Butyriboletus roseoflavus]